jgi:hypothetical protein
MIQNKYLALEVSNYSVVKQLDQLKILESVQKNFQHEFIFEPDFKEIIKIETYQKLVMVKDATAYLQQQLPDVETINVVLLEGLEIAEKFVAELESVLKEYLF